LYPCIRQLYVEPLKKNIGQILHNVYEENKNEIPENILRELKISYEEIGTFVQEQQWIVASILHRQIDEAVFPDFSVVNRILLDEDEQNIDEQQKYFSNIYRIIFSKNPKEFIDTEIHFFLKQFDFEMKTLHYWIQAMRYTEKSPYLTHMRQEYEECIQQIQEMIDDFMEQWSELYVQYPYQEKALFMLLKNFIAQMVGNTESLLE